jgi:hypothetical protein
MRNHSKPMSPLGHERPIGPIYNISALPPIADMRADIDLRRCGPKAVINAAAPGEAIHTIRKRR